ncbi:MAG: hypothetical protein ACRD8W_01585 [Nitrososphaeraceae archaeon]
MKRNLVHINIPIAMYEAIKDLVVTEGMYRGAPEFMLECTRNKLFELKKLKIERQKLNIYFKKLKEKRNQTSTAPS